MNNEMKEFFGELSSMLHGKTKFIILDLVLLLLNIVVYEKSSLWGLVLFLSILLFNLIIMYVDEK